MPFRMANGARIPAIGLGTFRLKGDACARAVETALQVGYRHVDTAAMYENEVDVGRGLKAAGLPRDAVFVTTKVWRDRIAAGELQDSARQSLDRLGLESVDLLLIHWPNAKIPLADSIAALCDAKKRGLTRHVGVANFPAAMLAQAARLAETHGEKLAVNQCEYHPRLNQATLLDACRAHGVLFVSYCPLGQGSFFDDAVIQRLVASTGRTPAQVVLRWHLQQAGVAAIPKSSSRAHIVENLGALDFELESDEMAALSAMGSPDGRIVRPQFHPAWD